MSLQSATRAKPYSPQIDLLPDEQRPRPRVLRDAAVCTDVELLAALLGGQNQLELAQELLERFDGLIGLRRADPAELMQVYGIGAARAAQIKASLETGSRTGKERSEERPQIHNPGDAANLVLYDLSALEQEELRVMLLDTRNRLMDIITLYRGSTNSSMVRIGELFKAAIRRNATSIIILHSHPSGDPTPSPDDVAFTRAAVQAGKLLDIETTDHIVIGGGRYISMKDRGLGF